MSDKRVKPKYQQLLEFIFYGNYFYGICAIALSVEAMLRQRLRLNSFCAFLREKTG